jgi:hypothetical protein
MKIKAVVIIIFLTFNSIGFGQSIKWEYYKYNLHVGPFSNAIVNDLELVYEDIIVCKNVNWLNLLFSKADLGKNSFIKLISLKDQHTQIVNSNSLIL